MSTCPRTLEKCSLVCRADSWDESDGPSELYGAPKPLDNDCVPYGTHKPTDDGWSTPFGSTPTPVELPSSPQFVMAAQYKCMYGTEALGFPPPCARTALRTSNAAAGHPRGHTPFSVWFYTTVATFSGCFGLVRTLRSLRSSMMVPRPYETTAQRG